MLIDLNKKYILSSLIILTFTSGLIFANCGNCGTNVSDEKKLVEVVEKKSSALVTSIPKSGKIEGFVITSCGMCNFGYKKIRGCNLTVKIGDTVYPVEGSGMHDHGDPHSSEGFCSTIRIAHVTGKIKKGKFYSDSFTLIESPN